MTKTLELQFLNTAGKTVKISIASPVEQIPFGPSYITSTEPNDNFHSNLFL